MKLTEQEKERLSYIREAAYSNMWDISKDFVGDWRADSGAWICDAFSEYADGAISIYTRDQLNYFVEHQDECETALLNMYDAQSLYDVIKNEGLVSLEAKAAVYCMYENNYNHLSEDTANILICILIDWLIGHDLDLDCDLDNVIDDLRSNYMDCTRICDVLTGLEA